VPRSIRYITDPACEASWSIEPALRKLRMEFAADIEFTYVMAGLHRELDAAEHPQRMAEWLRAAADSGMPADPLLWVEGPLKSTYPACMAVKAASEQGKAEEFLRSAREGIMCFRRKLDTTEALVEEARRAGLDVERFRVDLGSHAIVELFGADLEEARAVEGLRLPALRAGDGPWLTGVQNYSAYREAAIRAGAEPSGDRALAPRDALARFGRMATAEVEAVCDLPGPRAHAELWALAADWRVKPTRVLTGWLWEPA
jgi:predicted DsbA family dithiol-disulfide isomerase